MSDDLEYVETISQPYENCCFSAGFVFPHPVDTLYLKLDRPADGEPLIIIMRPDEAAAIAWCLTGVLWSDHMGTLLPDEPLRLASNKSGLTPRAPDEKPAAVKAALPAQNILSRFAGWLSAFRR